MNLCKYRCTGVFCCSSYSSSHPLSGKAGAEKFFECLRADQRLITFSALIDHERHDLQRFFVRIFDGMALTNLDHANIACCDLSLGTVIVHEDSFSFDHVIRLSILDMLMGMKA